MPLTGSPKKDIPELIKAGHPQKQAVAIALKTERGDAGGRSVEERLRVAKEMFDQKMRNASGPAERMEAKEDYEEFVKALKAERKDGEPHPELRDTDGEMRDDDEAYKGHRIIPGAANTFAVFKGNSAIKTKLPSIDAAKKWIDSRKDGEMRDDASAEVVSRHGKYTLLEGSGPSGGMWFVKHDGKVAKFKSRGEAEDYMKRQGANDAAYNQFGNVARTAAGRSDSDFWSAMNARLADVAETINVLTKRADMNERDWEGVEEFIEEEKGEEEHRGDAKGDTCPKCSGSGKLANGDRCLRCMGTGTQGAADAAEITEAEYKKAKKAEVDPRTSDLDLRAAYKIIAKYEAQGLITKKSQYDAPPCPACHGSGIGKKGECPTCHGTGKAAPKGIPKKVLDAFEEEDRKYKDIHGEEALKQHQASREKYAKEWRAKTPSKETPAAKTLGLRQDVNAVLDEVAETIHLLGKNVAKFDDDCAMDAAGRKYYTLVIDGAIHFGDYDREVVKQEMEDECSSRGISKSRCKIVTSGDSQAEIDKAIRGDALVAGRSFKQLADELQRNSDGWAKQAYKDPPMRESWMPRANKCAEAARWCIEKGIGKATAEDILQIQLMLK